MEQQGEGRSSTQINPRETPDYYLEDEINLFDLWNLLVRRWRWIVGFGLSVVLLGVGYMLSRAEQYEYTQVVEIAPSPAIGSLKSSVQSLAHDGPRFLEPPDVVVAKLEEKYLPQAIGSWREVHPKAGWQPRVDSVSAGGAGVITLRAEGQANHESAYRKIFEDAVRELREDHEVLLRSSRQVLQLALSRTRNQLETLRQKRADRQREVRRIEEHGAIVRDEIKALQSLLEDTVDRLARAQQGSSDPANAVAVAMLTDQLFSAREHLDELRVWDAVTLPRQRDEVESEFSELEREMEILKEEVALLESRTETIAPTRTHSELRRSVEPVGTSDSAIVALSVVLGGMLGVFATFFVEFVHVANRRRREGDEMSAQA